MDVDKSVCNTCFGAMKRTDKVCKACKGEPRKLDENYLSLGANRIPPSDDVTVRKKSALSKRDPSAATRRKTIAICDGLEREALMTSERHQEVAASVNKDENANIKKPAPNPKPFALRTQKSCVSPQNDGLTDRETHPTEEDDHSSEKSSPQSARRVSVVRSSSADVPIIESITRIPPSCVTPVRKADPIPLGQTISSMSANAEKGLSSSCTASKFTQLHKRKSDFLLETGTPFSVEKLSSAGAMKYDVEKTPKQFDVLDSSSVATMAATIPIPAAEVSNATRESIEGTNIVEQRHTLCRGDSNASVCENDYYHCYFRSNETNKVCRINASMPYITIEKTNMVKYYPNKLSWMDIVKIRKIQTPPVLSVIEQLMMLDYRAPLTAITSQKIPGSEVVPSKNPTIPSCGNPFDKLRNHSNKKQSACTVTLHPMDIMNVIFNCSDNILLQALMDKLFLCRLSIPLVFPDPRRNSLIFLMWALRGITPEFNSGTDSKEQSPLVDIKQSGTDSKKQSPLVDIKQSFVSFMRIGRLHFSKSKLLNEILSSKHHDTFFHRDCKYGMTDRIDSNGTIEASWYLPSEGDREGFESMFTLLNLRGESIRFPVQSKWLCSVSDLVFVMIDLKILLTEQYKEFIVANEVSESQFVICFVAERFDQIDEFRAKGIFEKCHMCFSENKIRVLDVLCNWSDDQERLLSIEEWKTEAQNTIKNFLLKCGKRKALTEFEIPAQKVGFRIDEHDPLCKDTFGASSCRLAYKNTEKLTESIVDVDPVERKLRILPLQGSLWKKWGRLKKELYREKVSANDSIEQFIAQKEREQLDVRKEQFAVIQKNLSTLLIEIGSKFETNQAFRNQYFVMCLQLIFNKWSKAIMPSLNKEYYFKLKENRIKLSKLLNDKEKRAILEANIRLGEEMNNASFGIEHIFREFGQMFEVTDSLRKHVPIHDKFRMISYFPDIVAHLILQGLPFEIMDGDTGFIPSTWVTAVLEAMKNINGEKKIFIISVIGIQSSGKSTLLNTMFGLNFSVSAGRCTRGVFFVMIPVDRDSMGVDYDYLMVIDTEGLRALETQEAGLIHENELATFVVGLGDVTIVNIKGENSADLNDVLQIVIHAMIRIRLVDSNLVKPSCLFVHQNVPSIEADDKCKIEQEKLLAKLDDITAKAAEAEKVAHIKRFEDVISYDEHKHVFYMPDLWQGQPPMAPVNSGYSDKVRKIKDMLTHNIARKSRLSTLTSFASRLSDLWDAILKEDFVFGFKNSEEVQAYSRLDRKFTELYWKFKDSSLKLHVECQNIVPFVEETLNLEQRGNELEQRIRTELNQINAELEKDLLDYFEESEHKDMLAQWREQYKINLQYVCFCELTRIIRVLHENVNSRIKQLEINTNLKVKITETAMNTALYLRENNTELDDESLRDYFIGKWPEWLSSDSSNEKSYNPVPEILSAFRIELHHMFSSHVHFLQEALKENQIEKHWHCNFENYSVEIQVIDLEYINPPEGQMKSKISNFAVPKSEEPLKPLKKAEEQCKTILETIANHLQSQQTTDFHPGQVTKVLSILNNFFSESDGNKYKHGFMLSLKFRIRFTIDVCKCCANEFIKHKLEYLDTNSPSAEVNKRKDDFFNLFKNTYRNIANEIIAEEWFNTEIYNWMFSTVKRKMGLIIFNAVLTDESSCFETKQQFLNRILIDIGELRDFGEYIEYIENKTEYFVRKIREYVLAILDKPDPLDTTKTKLLQLINNERLMYVSRVRNSLEQLLHMKSFVDTNDYISKLKMKIGTPSHETRVENEFSSLANGLTIIERMEIKDFGRFTQRMIDTIGSTQELIFIPNDQQTRTAALFSNLQFPSGTDPVELLLERVLGCKERCPFCRTPCKYTNKDHAGDHSALQHCPIGVIGYRDTDSKQLDTYNCQSAVASDLSFRSLITNAVFEPFKQYRKYFPTWEIVPERSMNSSLYWKWFMCTFHDDLVVYFDGKHGDLPDEWKQIQWEEAKQSLLNDN